MNEKPMPPFSGDESECVKCGNVGAYTNYRKKGEPTPGRSVPSDRWGGRAPMNCDCKLASCGPAVARWSHGNGNISRLCRACLDCWFGNADDDDDLEPVSWSWIGVAA